jgi:hypothetical protein
MDIAGAKTGRASHGAVPRCLLKDMRYYTFFVALPVPGYVSALIMPTCLCLPIQRQLNIVLELTPWAFSRPPSFMSEEDNRQS